MALHGVEVRFRGETIRVLLSPGQPGMDLQTGGLSTTASWRLRFPATLQPAPGFLGRAAGSSGIVAEPITEIATGRKFFVTSCIPAPPDSAAAQEHIVEAQLA